MKRIAWLIIVLGTFDVCGMRHQVKKVKNIEKIMGHAVHSSLPRVLVEGASFSSKRAPRKPLLKQDDINVQQNIPIGESKRIEYEKIVLPVDFEDPKSDTQVIDKEARERVKKLLTQKGTGFTAGKLSQNLTVRKVLNWINTFVNLDVITRYVDKDGYIFEKSFDSEGKEQTLPVYYENGILEARKQTIAEYIKSLIGYNTQAKVNIEEWQKVESGLKTKSLPKIKSANTRFSVNQKKTYSTQAFGKQLFDSSLEKEFKKRLSTALKHSKKIFELERKKLIREWHPDFRRSQEEKKNAHEAVLAINKIAQRVLSGGGKSTTSSAERNFQDIWIKNLMLKDEKLFNQQNIYSKRAMLSENKKPYYYQVDIDPENGEAKKFSELACYQGEFIEIQGEVPPDAKDYLVKNWLRSVINNDHEKWVLGTHPDKKKKDTNTKRYFYEQGRNIIYLQLERNDLFKIVNVAPLTWQNGRFVVDNNGTVAADVYEHLIEKVAGLDSSLLGENEELKKIQEEREAQKILGMYIGFDKKSFNQGKPNTHFREAINDKEHGKYHYFEVEVNPSDGTLLKITELECKDGNFYPLQRAVDQQTKDILISRWMQQRWAEDMKDFNQEKEINAENLSQCEVRYIADKYYQLSIDGVTGVLKDCFELRYSQEGFIRSNNGVSDQIKTRLYGEWMRAKMKNDKKIFDLRHSMQKGLLRIVINAGTGPLAQPEYYEIRADIKKGEVTSVTKLKHYKGGFIPDLKKLNVSV